MKNNEPLVSIIMNCYNGEKYLKEAIDSVLAQTYSNFEIIFWDNQSTDRSKEIARSYKDDRIKYFYAREHVPLGRARNLALKEVSGEYICFLDVDDLWKSEKLKKQIPYFEDPSIGLVYSQTNIINSESKIVGHYFNLKPVVNKYSLLSFPDFFTNYDLYMSSAIISKRALLSTAKEFDNLLVYAEEFDLFMRIFSKYKAIRVEESLTLYRVHENQETLRLYKRSIDEQEYIISKLRLLYPDLFTIYPDLIITINKELAWRHFLNFILKNNSFRARQKLVPFVFSSFKYFVFYLLSFFGTNPVKYIWKEYRKNSGNFMYFNVEQE